MWQTKQLILHGSIVLLVGLLSGAGFGTAIVRGKSEAAARAWRVAHSGLLMGGVLLLALAGSAAAASQRVSPRCIGLGVRRLELCVCRGASLGCALRSSRPHLRSAVRESGGLCGQHHRCRGVAGRHADPRVGRLSQPMIACVIAFDRPAFGRWRVSSMARTDLSVTIQGWIKWTEAGATHFLP
jgi:hypothetical protein